MLNIYAHSFFTASRINANRLRPAPRADDTRWLPKGHWWLRPEREVDPEKL